MFCIYALDFHLELNGKMVNRVRSSKYISIPVVGFKCSKWGIHIPGGGVNCQAQNPGSSCYAYCNTNKTFMELPGTSAIPLECTEDEDEGIWNRLPPVCGMSSFYALTPLLNLR